MFWFNRENRKAKRKARNLRRGKLGRSIRPEHLEERRLLSITATNHMYTASNVATLSVPAASGLLYMAMDMNNLPMTAHLVGSVTNGSATVNGDGSFAFNATTGYSGVMGAGFNFDITDTGGSTSSTYSVTITVKYGLLSAVDVTKLATDTVHVPMQILGDSSGEPATANNLSIVYDSVAAHPDQVLEANIQPSMHPVVSDGITLATTFNGANSSSFVSTSNLSGNDPSIHLAKQVDTSSLSTGRYAYSMTVSGNNMDSSTTLSSYANVVNDASSPVGAGWDIAGLYHLTTNSSPSGEVLTDGEGRGWFFATGSGSSYTSPAGPYAFSTLTAVTGGGWQLTDQYGTQFNFSSAGALTSRVDRTGFTTTYTWTSGLLTAITDPFSRSVTLSYSSGLLATVTDYAGNVWSFAHSSSNLSSVTLPNPGGGAPVWSFSYGTNHYLTSVSDPLSNSTSFSYDSTNRLSGVTLPGGATTSATSETTFGYGSASSGSPANSTTVASVTPSSTDANGHTSDYQVDYFGNLVSQTDPNGNVTTWARDSNGLVTTLTQPAPTTGGTQPVTTYSYDSLGNETSASGALDSFGTYAYNSFSEPTSFDNSLSNTQTWSYDTHGNLTSQTDMLGNTVSYTVDSYGNRLTMLEPKPNNASGTITTSYAYDSKERLVTITFPDSNTQTFTYTTDDQLASSTDENSHTTLYSHDVLGRETSVEDALSNTVSYTYSKDNDLLTTTDQLGNVTTDAWNSRNELTSVTLPVPATGVSAPEWTYTYDANGDKLTQTDPMGAETSWSFTNLGQISSVTLPVPATGISAPVTSVTYDNLGREVTSTNSLSGVTTTAYNSNNWVTSVTAPDPGTGAPETQYGYNAIGEQTTITDPMGHVQTTAFTADGQVASVTDNLGDATSFTYGHDGEFLTTTNALSDTTSNSYNDRLWLVSTTDANSGTTQYGYDPAGNRVSLTDSVGNEDQYTYSATNQVLTDTNQLGYAISYVYNASGDLTQETDRNGLVRDFTFDNLHRETAEKWMNGSTVVNTIAYAYNADSEVTSAGDSYSSYAYTLDNLGRVTGSDNSGTPNIPHVVLNAQYDAMNDRTQLSATVAGTADFLNAYSFDADQNMLSATQQGQTGGNGVAPKGVGYSYNLDSQITQTLDFDPTTASPHPDIAYGTVTYDAANRLTGIDYQHASTTLDDLTWAYNAANLVTSFSSSADSSTASYSYDTVNEVTASSYTGNNQPGTEAYSFDKNGNRTNTGYTTGTNNQLTSDGTFNYTYDHEGNRVSRTRISSGTASDYLTTYTWDYRNRLTDVDFYNNSSVLTKHVHYIYDVYDHLIGKQLDPNGGGSYTSSEWYALDLGADPSAPALPVVQFDKSGNETYRFLNGPTAGGVDAVMGVLGQEAIGTQGSAGTTTYALADNLGSVRMIVSAASVIVDDIVYDSFGNVSYESGTVAHWSGYAGYHFDSDTGLANASERWYDPAVGRWISEDPIRFRGGDSNVSRYVGNDTTDSVDPSGLKGSGYQGMITPADVLSDKATAAQYAAQQTKINNAVAADEMKKMRAAEKKKMAAEKKKMAEQEKKNKKMMESIMKKAEDDAFSSEAADEMLELEGAVKGGKWDFNIKFKWTQFQW